ncbi:MAG: K(+)-transporting ATPase subunit F [Bryobacterales bacterium]|nr:K(+)-transporting ATPase subunit F [Bryobacterales bacterium]
MPWPAKSSESEGKSMDYALAALCATLLFLYLVYALLKPETF